MSKSERYETLLKQFEALTSDEDSIQANMSNMIALVHREFDFWWTGFYFIEANELVLDPFQGPVACTRIEKGKGVCGTAWHQDKTQIVADVHQFPGHIACSAESNSEIVIPIKHNGNIIGVLDVDSTEFNCFDEIDERYLQKMLSLIWK